MNDNMEAEFISRMNDNVDGTNTLTVNDNMEVEFKSTMNDNTDTDQKGDDIKNDDSTMFDYGDRVAMHLDEIPDDSKGHDGRKHWDCEQCATKNNIKDKKCVKCNRWRHILKSEWQCWVCCRVNKKNNKGRCDSCWKTKYDPESNFRWICQTCDVMNDSMMSDIVEESIKCNYCRLPAYIRVEGLTPNNQRPDGHYDFGKLFWKTRESRENKLKYKTWICPKCQAANDAHNAYCDNCDTKRVTLRDEFQCKVCLASIKKKVGKCPKKCNTKWDASKKFRWMCFKCLYMNDDNKQEVLYCQKCKTKASFNSDQWYFEKRQQYMIHLPV